MPPLWLTSLIAMSVETQLSKSAKASWGRARNYYPRTLFPSVLWRPAALALSSFDGGSSNVKFRISEAYLLSAACKGIYI